MTCPPTPGPISDEALVAFVDWCRLNPWRLVYDKALMRRVFDAYASVAPLDSVLERHWAGRGDG